MVKYKDQALDLIFQALSDPTRRQILKMVAHKDCRATELADKFNMSFPAVSKHLKVLEGARLVRREVRGRVHRFYLKEEAMKQAYQWVKTYEKFWLTQLGQLDEFLKSKHKGEKS